MNGAPGSRLLAQSVPRYTSYPTAPHFSADAGPGVMESLLGEAHGAPVSLYAHIPFCDRLCWFCGCHTRQTRKYAPVAAYLDTLIDEIALVSGKAARPLDVARVHLGGGSPSILRPDDFARLRTALEENFDLRKDAEISIEIDPADIGENTIEGFAALGMNRASIGVQDFDPRVQEAINRPQSFELTRDVVVDLRKAGISSLNIDALFGLPHQTLESVGRTIEQVISLAPDRVALFGYAHVPWMKKHQRMIDENALPDSEERIAQSDHARALLLAAGYEAIGIDHFALPGDSLAIATREGRLKRNFQGYTTDECPTLLGLGASSISQSPEGYVQNIVATGQYRAAIAEGRLPASRGFALGRDDVIRSAIIESLMCRFAVDFGDLFARFGEVVRPYVCEMRRAAALDEEGLVLLEDEALRVRDDARPFVRIVASWFDAYLDAGEARYSKAV